MVRKKYEIKMSGDGDLFGFLTKLITSGTKIASVSVSNGIARFRTDRKGVKAVRQYRRRYRLKAKIELVETNKNASAIFSSSRFLIACIVPFCASFFLWTVDVESDMPEVNDRIEVKLKNASIVPFRPLTFIPNEGDIRRELMRDEPGLSWVRFKREGSKLTVIPMLSPPANNVEVEEAAPSDLIARTGGLITRFELLKGERVSHVHQTVKKGDLLATGTLVQGSKTSVVGADGAVYADYWIEYSFDLPKIVSYQVQGEEIVELTFVAPWKNTDYHAGNLENWLPWRFISTNRHIEEKTMEFELTPEMEKTVLIPLLKNKLSAEFKTEAIIQEEKILHVSFEDDRVNGTILFLVNDNIAVKRPISQGD